jgi:hypothetical protein
MQRNGQKVAVARSLDNHQGVMLMRKAFAIAVLIGIVALIAYHLSRPKPLRPIVATWQEVGRVDAIVDLDADGNDELLVLDKSGQLWWVQFRLPKPIRQKIPVPKDAEWFTNFRGQMLVFMHPKTRRAFLITRQGGKWATKDLGILKGCAVKDADYDGQVNDVVVWREQRRTVFSRLKDGTIVERPDLPDWRADLDGDGKEDAVYQVSETEVRIHCSSGRKASLKLPPFTFIAVTDMDGDKVAEIIGVEGYGGVCHLHLHCWRYENRRWFESSSQEFGKMFWLGMLGDDTSLLFLASGFGGVWLFLDEKDAWLLAVTVEKWRAKFWEVRWREGKWTKRLMGEVPERNANKIWLVRKGQDWMVGGWASLPKWQKWLWEKIGQPLQHFFPFLHEPQGRVFVYGWDGKRRWALLGRWREGNFLGVQLADMDGDRKREVSIAFPKRVLVAKFEDGRWHTGWVEVPFVWYKPVGVFFGFRYGGREWAIYQDRDSHHCIAIALEGDSQQSKRHQPQRRD